MFSQSASVSVLSGFCSCAIYILGASLLVEDPGCGWGEQLLQLAGSLLKGCVCAYICVCVCVCVCTLAEGGWVSLGFWGVVSRSVLQEVELCGAEWHTWFSCKHAVVFKHLRSCVENAEEKSDPSTSGMAPYIPVTVCRRQHRCRTVCL